MILGIGFGLHATCIPGFSKGGATQQCRLGQLEKQNKTKNKTQNLQNLRIV